MILVDLFDRVSIDVILNSFVCLIRFQIYTGSFVLYAKLITRFHGWSFLCRSPFFWLQIRIIEAQINSSLVFI